jgi:dTDP-4-dehydrorhamnose reductase
MTNNLKIPSIVNSIETSAYPTPAKRPAFSVLDCSKMANECGVLSSNWQEGIRQVVRKLEQ